MPEVKTRDIGQGIIYEYNPVHRNGTPGKSQWRITEIEESDSFICACDHLWVLDKVGWGFHFKEGKVQYLGVAQDHRTLVFIAKFVNDKPHNTWHGYPADHQKKQQDIPDDEIRALWIAEGVLPAQKIRKIGSAQPCKL